jgi:pyruvate dehydrogenase (quinone)
MITVPEQAEVAVGIACRTPLIRRGVSHLTIHIDVQEKKLSGKYSRHNVAYHLMYMLNNQFQVNPLIEKAAKVLNSGSRIVIRPERNGWWLNELGFFTLVSMQREETS